MKLFLLCTMQNMQNSQLPCFIPSISLKPFSRLAFSICHLSLSLSTAPTLHFPALLCFPRSPPSLAVLFNFMLFFKVPLFTPFSYLVLFQLVLSNLALIPASVHFLLSASVISLPLSPFVSPRSVKAVPATFCSQYPLI